MMNTEKQIHDTGSRVVVVGGSNVDLKGYSDTDYLPRTSNPGEVVEKLGGVGRNIAESLGLLGVSTSLITAVGDDHYGDVLVKSTRKESLDLSRVLRSQDYNTGRYLVLHDESGEMVGAISDMKVMGEITPAYLEQNRGLIESSEVLALDANPGSQALEKLFSILQDNMEITVVADPVSVDKAVKLRKHLDSIDVVTPGEDEACALFQLDNPKSTELEKIAESIRNSLRASGLEVDVVVTSRSKGLALATREGIHLMESVSVPDEAVMDTTGAGDTLTAAMIYALLAGDSIMEGLDLGSRAAAEAIKSRRTVNLDLYSVVADKEDN